MGRNRIVAALAAVTAGASAVAQTPYLVKDIRSASGVCSSTPQTMVALGGFVLMQASDEQHGAELWRTDGTPAGT